MEGDEMRELVVMVSRSRKSADVPCEWLECPDTDCRVLDHDAELIEYEYACAEVLWPCAELEGDTMSGLAHAEVYADGGAGEDCDEGMATARGKGTARRGMGASERGRGRRVRW